MERNLHDRQVGAVFSVSELNLRNFKFFQHCADLAVSFSCEWSILWQIIYINWAVQIQRSWIGF